MIITRRRSVTGSHRIEVAGITQVEVGVVGTFLLEEGPLELLSQEVEGVQNPSNSRNMIILPIRQGMQVCRTMLVYFAGAGVTHGGSAGHTQVRPP